jgi:hypothetical protein
LIPPREQCEPLSKTFPSQKGSPCSNLSSCCKWAQERKRVASLLCQRNFWSSVYLTCPAEARAGRLSQI